MFILNKIFSKDAINEAIKKLQNLGKNFMNGLSEDDDLIEWDNNLTILKSEALKSEDNMYVNCFLEGINEIFIKYLIKHHPNNGRLKLFYENNQDINAKRQSMYREMLLLTLCEATTVVHKWNFNKKADYESFISRIKEYVYYMNDSKNTVHTTAKCESMSDKEIFSLIKDVQIYVMDYTKEQKLWHLRVSQLDTFKFN